MGLGHTLMEHYLCDDAGPDPEPRARSTTGSRRAWTCPSSSRATIDRERRRARPVRREGDERGRAAVRGAGGRGGGPRRDGRRDPGPAADARSGSGGRSGRRRTRPRDLGLRVRRSARDARRRCASCCWAARRPTSRRWRCDLGLPGAARRSRSPPRRAGRSSPAGWPDGLDEEIRAAMAALEARVGRRFGDAGGSAAGLGPVGGAAVDARDDGHDPQPRARTRRRPRRGWRGPRAMRRSRRLPCDGSGSSTAPSSASEAPADPWAQLRRRDRGGVPVVDGDRARAYRRARGDRGRPRDGGRRSRRWCSATAAPTRGPACCSRATRRPARPSCTATCCSTRRARTWSPGTHATEPIAVLDERMPAVSASCARHADRSSATTATAATSSSRSRTAGCGCSRSGSASGRPQAALRMAVEMAEDPAFPLSRAEAVRRVPPLLADPPTRGAPARDRRRADRRGWAPRPGRVAARSADAGGRRRGRRGRARRDPRPRRDLARRRRTAWPGRRDPDRDGRLREPRRRRGARVGHPGGGRRGRCRGRRRCVTIGGRRAGRGRR